VVLVSVEAELAHPEIKTVASASAEKAMILFFIATTRTTKKIWKQPIGYNCESQRFPAA
jgi:hypothetical protein